MPTFKISFDKEDKIYKPGDLVICKVEANVEDEFMVRILGLKLCGNAHTEWKNSSTSKTYTGDQELFQKCHYFIHKPTNQYQSMMPGNHKYTASFLLPKNLPSSIEHTFGYIRYTAKIYFDGKIDIGNIWIEFISESNDDLETFFVDAELTLNDVPHLNNPVMKKSKKAYIFCCSIPEHVTITSSLPKKGFSPGEKIPLNVVAENKSNSKFDWIRIQLIKMMTFIDNTGIRMKVEKTILVEHRIRVTFKPHQTFSVKKNLYLDPTMNCKSFKYCDIIFCDFYIKSTFENNYVESEAENKLNIIIGINTSRVIPLPLVVPATTGELYPPASPPYPVNALPLHPDHHVNPNSFNDQFGHSTPPYPLTEPLMPVVPPMELNPIGWAIESESVNNVSEMLPPSYAEVVNVSSVNQSNSTLISRLVNPIPESRASSRFEISTEQTNPLQRNYRSQNISHSRILADGLMGWENH